MRLDVEKLFISSIENDATFENIIERSLFETPAAILAAKNPTANERATLPSAHASILAPDLSISDILLPSVITKVVISDI